MENILLNLSMLEYLITHSDDGFIIVVVDNKDLKEKIISMISSIKKTFVDNVGFKRIKTDEDIVEFDHRIENMKNPEVKNIIFNSLEEFNQNYIYICQLLNFNRDFYKELHKNVILLMTPKMYVYFLRHAVDLSSFCFKFDFSDLNDKFFHSDEFEDQYIKDKNSYQNKW
jgi:hypothetical protein